MTYVTFSGEKKLFDEIDHQHLSNIYWYSLIIRELSESGILKIKNRLEEVYGGILPYHPHPDFQQEIDDLELLGCLIWDLDKTCADIFFNESKVGEFYTKKHIRDNKISIILT